MRENDEKKGKMRRMVMISVKCIGWVFSKVAMQTVNVIFRRKYYRNAETVYNVEN